MNQKRIYLILGIIGVVAFFVYKLFMYYAPPSYRQPYQMNLKPDDTLRIAYIGDSWAYLHEYHECRLAHLLADTLHRPVRVNSYGISGLTSREIYENMYNNSDFKYFLTKNRYDYCYISAGINDTYRKMSTSYFAESMKNIVQLLLYNNIHPIIQEIPDYDINISYYWQDRAKKLHRRLSMLINNTPLDCKQMFRDALDEMINENGYQNKVNILRYKSWNHSYTDDLNHLYLVDRLHLNGQGYAKLDSMIAEEIISAIGKIKKKTDGEVSVAKYRYDRQCAVSLTFDDGIQEDYTLIAPHLDRYGLKGSFGINGAFIGNLDDHYAPRMTWEQCRELQARGHEIANHSWSHQNESEISIEETRLEIARNDSVIQKELGKRPLAYFFPYNAYSPEALAAAMENRVACRLYQFGLGQRNLGATWDSMTSWLNEQIEGGKWGVTMSHGIYTAWDQWKEPWLLWNFFCLLSEKSDSVWTATFSDVAMYVTERDSVQLTVKHEKDLIRITSSLNLNPQLFRMPLTLNINSSKPMTASQDGMSLPILRNGTKSFLEFSPYGGEIVIMQKNDNFEITK